MKKWNKPEISKLDVTETFGGADPGEYEVEPTEHDRGKHPSAS